MPITYACFVIIIIIVITYITPKDNTI